MTPKIMYNCLPYYPIYNTYTNTSEVIKETSLFDNSLNIREKSDKMRNRYNKFHNNKTFKKK